MGFSWWISTGYEASGPSCNVIEKHRSCTPEQRRPHDDDESFLSPARVLGKFLSDAAWYFYLFWLPKYLCDVHGFDTKQVGSFAWIPYAASGLGSLAGGWFSSWLLGRGKSLNFSRKAALGASAAIMPLIVFVTRSPVDMAIVLFSLAFFGQQSLSTLVMILPAGRKLSAPIPGSPGPSTVVHYRVGEQSKGTLFYGFFLRAFRDLLRPSDLIENDPGAGRARF